VITDVPGLRVGHWTHRTAATGCTVVLFPEGTVASGEVRGGAPASRETDLLDPTRLVSRVDALLLTGGSAFGLAAADGVMRFCEERGMGVPTPAGAVPIVVGLGLFDLAVGDPTVRPGPGQGYAACEAATAGPVELGAVGAGTGATVGLLPGQAAAVSAAAAGPVASGPAGSGPVAAGSVAAGSVASGPAGSGPVAAGSVASGPVASSPAGGGPVDAGPAGGGAAGGGVAGPQPGPPAGAGGGVTGPAEVAPARAQGGVVSATVRSGDLVVSALAAVNAFGVVDGDDARAPDLVGGYVAAAGGDWPAPYGNTTIGLVATNARLDKVGCHLVAQSAHDGLARAVFPAHTRLDGDAFVAAAVGGVAADVDAVRTLAVHAVAAAIRALPSVV
jgi:L-aminopeptidase/D-esterase-like protein